MLPEKFVVYGAVHTSEIFPPLLTVDRAAPPNVNPGAVTLEMATLAKEPTPIIPQPLAVVRAITAVEDEPLLTMLDPSSANVAEHPPPPVAALLSMPCVSPTLFAVGL